jgi:succinate dehydrogenase hydrophobic anchor subunit
MRYIYFCYCLMLTNNNKTIVLDYFNSREKVRFEIQNVAYYWYFFFIGLGLVLLYPHSMSGSYIAITLSIRPFTLS